MTTPPADRFAVAPCGHGWHWVIDFSTATASHPRPTKAEAEKARREIVEQWEAHEKSIDKNQNLV